MIGSILKVEHYNYKKAKLVKLRLDQARKHGEILEKASIETEVKALIHLPEKKGGIAFSFYNEASRS